MQPWSGFYEADMPVVWATAHLSQFTSPGWKYLKVGTTEGGSGELPGGGYYAGLVSPNGDDFTLMVVKISRDHAPCTRPGLPDFDTSDEVATFAFPQGVARPSKPLHVWYSNFEADPKTAPLFQSQGTVEVGADGSFSLNVTVGSVYTVSTVATATKGKPAAAVPKSAPAFPLPYTDDFQSYNESGEAKYVSVLRYRDYFMYIQVYHW